MAANVIRAFEDFLANEVTLDTLETAKARRSRDWLVTQIDAIRQDDEFPILYPEVHTHYGSFARNTKIRELDDVDLIVGISALGTTYLDNAGTVTMTVPDGIALRRLCHEGTALLNSRRVINTFVKHLTDVPQYRKAELKRNGSAAVLDLASYAWSFDIVPAFFTKPEYDGRTYYIIPDGNGHWMKTDPRIDTDRVSSINQRHDGHVLNVIRVIKYWNRRPTMPSIPSYMLECLILTYYENRLSIASEFVDMEIPDLLDHVASAVLSPVADPKGIQGDLNTLEWEARYAIYQRAGADAGRARVARAAEIAKNYSASIQVWRQIFGASFPTYTND